MRRLQCITSCKQRARDRWGRRGSILPLKHFAFHGHVGSLMNNCLCRINIIEIMKGAHEVRRPRRNKKKKRHVCAGVLTERRARARKSQNKRRLTDGKPAESFAYTTLETRDENNQMDITQ